MSVYLFLHLENLLALQSPFGLLAGSAEVHHLALTRRQPRGHSKIDKVPTSHMYLCIDRHEVGQEKRVRMSRLARQKTLVIRQYRPRQTRRLELSMQETETLYPQRQLRHS